MTFNSIRADFLSPLLSLFSLPFFFPQVDPIELPAVNKSVMGFNLIWMFSKVDQLLGLMDELYGMDLEPPLVGQTFAFGDMPNALRLFQSGNTTGKVVIHVDNDDDGDSDKNQ